jgi:hypothetical protein
LIRQTTHVSWAVGSSGSMSLSIPQTSVPPWLGAGVNTGVSNDVAFATGVFVDGAAVEVPVEVPVAGAWVAGVVVGSSPPPHAMSEAPARPRPPTPAIRSADRRLTRFLTQ